MPVGPVGRFGTVRRLGCLTQIILALAFGVVVVVFVTAVAQPWAFTLGGRFHPLASWQGWGRVRSRSGTFVVFVRVTPMPARRYRGTGRVRGVAYVCTPAGERYSLTLRGGTSDRVWSDMNGKSFSLDLTNRPWYWSIAGDSRQWRPRLSFSGKWSYPDLLLTDGGTLAREFQADGRLAPKPLSIRPQNDSAPLTLKEGAESEFEAACGR